MPPVNQAPRQRYRFSQFIVRLLTGQEDPFINGSRKRDSLSRKGSTMDYDAALDYEPTDQEIDVELRRHGSNWAEFTRDNPRPVDGYSGADVLNWLGY